MDQIESELNIAHEIQLLLNSRGTSANHNAQANQPSCQTVRKRCTSCKDYGEQLIQCSSCSAAFHSECLDPPLARNSLPNCESFRCNECLWQATQRRTQRLAQTQSTDSNALPGEATKSDSHTKASKSDSEEGTLWTRAAQHVARRNPTEFSVPNEIVMNVPVPGCYKQQQVRSRLRHAPACYYCEQSLLSPADGANVQPIGDHGDVDDMGRRSDMDISRKGNKGKINTALLVRCDFCDAAFHLDCLPEPLTVAPSSNEWWMCPLHSEHILDRRIAETETKQLVNTLASHRERQTDAKRGRFLAQPRSSCASLSRRVAIWNELVRAPIDTHVTKAQFLRKLHRDAAWKRNNGGSRFTSFASVFNGWLQPTVQAAPAASASETESTIATNFAPSSSAQTKRRKVHVPLAVRRAYRERSAQLEVQPNIEVVQNKNQIGQQRLTGVEKKERNGDGKATDTALALLVYEKDGRRETITIRKNVFRIGVGSQNELSLTRIYPEADAQTETEPTDANVDEPDVHAVIVRDQLSCTFELLNYAECGTYVDGVLYAPECIGGWEGAAELRANSRVQMGRFTFNFLPLTDSSARADASTPASHTLDHPIALAL